MRHRLKNKAVGEGDLLMPFTISHRSVSMRILQVLVYIDENYTKTVKVSDAASLIGICSDYLCRRFRKETGVRFHNYLLRKRIQRAIQLFGDTPKSIKEISYDVGFSAPEIFSKDFKRLMGCSPRAYRSSSTSQSFKEVNPRSTS